MRCRCREGWLGRGLWPEAWSVNITNWHESQFLARTPLWIFPSSTISKQWHVGQVYAQVPQPRQARVSAGQKGLSKCSFTKARTWSASNRLSGPAGTLATRSEACTSPSNRRFPFYVRQRTSYSPPPNSSSIASEPRSAAGPRPTEVQKHEPSCAVQASVTTVVNWRRRLYSSSL